MAMLAFAITACNQQKTVQVEGHDHDDEAGLPDEQEDVKFQYTAYSPNFELFAEADAFVVGKTANVLSHFSKLPGFKPVEAGAIAIVLTINEKEVRQTLDKPTRTGIYSFDIQPQITGTGTLRFEITVDSGSFEVVVPEVRVFADHHQAAEAAQAFVVSKTNTTVFTKEQSWKIDYSSGFPSFGAFGQVIKTTAHVESAQADEIIVSAKTNGTVQFASQGVFEGNAVSRGQVLFSLSSSDLADNNLPVKYAGAKSNFEKAKSEYERARQLATDKIVSEKEMVNAQTEYDNARAIYDNLQKNFNGHGQSAPSPISGFVKQLFVKNGAYVEAGQPVLTISQNKTLVLSADMQQKYAPILGAIQSANIRTIHNNKVYTLDELNGRILSFGKAANSNNYLIPLKLQVDNSDVFFPGSFVELYLKTGSSSPALSVPDLALMEDQGAYFVFVQITPELFEKREVKIGVSDGLSTEILQGLTVNERIVTLGGILIKLSQATGSLDAHSGHVH
jgi:membrane fusion protein, heavy metal efflux system